MKKQKRGLKKSMKAKIKEKQKMIKNIQFKDNKNWKGHVAQWIEQLSDVEVDVGSKLLRKSHHAHRYFGDKKYNKENKKEKQAYSLDKTTLRRRGILHEFESVVKFNQNPQHNNYNNNNYLNFLVSLIRQ